MKKLLLLIFLTNLSFAMNVQKLNDKVLKCTRTLVKLNLRDSFENLEQAVNLLERLQRSQGSTQNHKALIKECKSHLKKFRKKSTLIKNTVLIDSFLNNHNVSPQIANSLRSLASYAQSCHLAGADVSVALGKSLGTGLRLGKCKRVDGKQYIVIIPKLSYGYGLGATATIGINNIKTNEPYYLEARVAAGFIFSGEADLNLKDDEQNDLALGLGAGLIAEAEQGLFINLMTVKNNFDEIKTYLGIGG